MKTIYKYPLKEINAQAIQMTSGAKILCAQIQKGAICIWAECEPNNPIKPRIIEIIGTGHPMDDSHRTYLGTVQSDGFVWHIYERINEIKS